LAADDHLADRDLAGLPQGLADDPVAFLGDAAVRNQVIRRVEIDRVDLIDEFAYVDRVGGLEPQPFQIVGIDGHVVALLVLEALDDLVALDRPDAGDDQLLSAPLARGLVDLVETDALALGRRGVETNRDRHQRELQVPRPVRAGGGCHRKNSYISFYANGIAATLFRQKNRPAAPGVGKNMALPLDSGNPPMEARPVRDLPEGELSRYEPKWGGFRCLTFRDGENVELRSKSGQPLG